MKGRLLSIVAGSLIAGILIGNEKWISLWCASIPAVGAVILYLFSIWRIRKNPFYKNNILFSVITALVFCSLGIFSACVSKPSQTNFPAGNYIFSGIVEDYIPTNSGERVVVKLSALMLENNAEFEVGNVKVQLLVPEAWAVDYGDRVSGKAELKPFDTPGNYLKDDYENYLVSKHIFLTGISSPGDFIVSKGRGSISSSMRRMRDRLEEGVENTPLLSETKAFLISVLFGDKSYIDREERISFADAGVAHIFAVSGFHVSMMAGFIILLLSVPFCGGIRHWKYLAALPFIWAYVLLVGAGPATCRAGIMLTFVMVAMFLQRKSNSLQALGWAIVIILAFDAGSLFDVGFQLSVICVSSLLLIAEPLNFVDRRRHPWLFRGVSLVLVAIVGSFSTWLVCAYYFHRFSLMFLPLNLFAVPLLPLYIAVSLFYVMLYAFGISFPFLAFFLDLCYSLFHNGSDYVVSLTDPITNIHPGVFSVVAWVIGLALLGLSLNRMSRTGIKRKIRLLLFPSGSFAAALVSLFLFPAHQPSGIILQKNSKAASIMCYDNGVERLVSLPEGISSSVLLNGRQVVALSSTDLVSDTRSFLKTADIILLCLGCKGLPDELTALLKPDCRLVTHPSLHWRNERTIIESAGKAGISVHSLRYGGPLHLFD